MPYEDIKFGGHRSNTNTSRQVSPVQFHSHLERHPPILLRPELSPWSVYALPFSASDFHLSFAKYRVQSRCKYTARPAPQTGTKPMNCNCVPRKMPYER